MRDKLLILIAVLMFTGGGIMVYQKVRGIRNNNPGNIKRSNDKWQGLSADQNDPVFFQFDTVEYGIRAMLKILTNYRKKYGLSTVRQIIDRWAPEIENPTSKYQEFVAKELGVGLDEQIDVFMRRIDLAKAITQFENGVNPYSQQTFEAAEALI